MNGNRILNISAYVHGFFDKKEIALSVICQVAKAGGIELHTEQLRDYSDFKDSQYNLLASAVREALDMEKLMAIIDAS